jgi:hypothetical protein
MRYSSYRKAQQVPLHGFKSNSTASEFGGENSRYQEDPGYGRIFAGKKGGLYSLPMPILDVKMIYHRKGKNKASEEGKDLDDLTDAENSQKPLKTTFELNDTLYAEAELEDSDTVFLWLGVRVRVTLILMFNSYMILKGQRYVIIQNPSCYYPTKI